MPGCCSRVMNAGGAAVSTAIYESAWIVSVYRNRTVTPPVKYWDGLQASCCEPGSSDQGWNDATLVGRAM